MEDRETPRMRKYGESKTTRIMMATVTHVTSGSGHGNFQAYGFLFDRVYIYSYHNAVKVWVCKYGQLPATKNCLPHDTKVTSSIFKDHNWQP